MKKFLKEKLYVDFNHLKTVDETYFQHFIWIMWANFMYIILLIGGTIHAIFPFLLAEWGDKTLSKLVDSFKARRKRTGRE